MVRAQRGSPSAQCDVGWAYHQGSAEAGRKDISIAAEWYQKAALQGYSPAASLLADLHYFGIDQPQNHEEAQKWLSTVVQMTDKNEMGDAYVRAKALQKLGILSWRKKNWKNNSGLPQCETLTGKETAEMFFSQSIELCQRHLKGGWAFLLSHDPPNLWENLEKESLLLTQMNEMDNVSNRFDLSFPSWRCALEYTKSLRTKENETEWLLELQLQTLQYFPSCLDAGAWGVTYFQSFYSIFGHPNIRALACPFPVPPFPPKIVVLGSALGSACVWPALLFGCRAVGFEVLPCCIEESRRLAAMTMSDSGSPLMIKFESVDVIAEQARVKSELRDANIVWVNDFSWPIPDQKVMSFCY